MITISNIKHKYNFAYLSIEQEEIIFKVCSEFEDLENRRMNEEI
jgi:hypothetical protein